MKRDQYIEAGRKHTEKDTAITREQASQVQKNINGNCKWFAVFSCVERTGFIVIEWQIL